MSLLILIERRNARKTRGSVGGEAVGTLGTFVAAAVPRLRLDLARDTLSAGSLARLGLLSACFAGGAES